VAPPEAPQPEPEIPAAATKRARAAKTVVRHKKAAKASAKTAKRRKK
jgi:hypothetical protein